MMNCNYCNRHGHGFLITEIELFSDVEKLTLRAPAQYILCVCSRACEKFLKEDPRTPEYINGQLEMFKQMHLDAERSPGYAEKIAEDRKTIENIMGDALGELGLKLGKPIGKDQ